MVSGLEALRLMFPSELTYNDSLFNIIPLFKSSNHSTTMQEFFNLNPDPNANPSFHQLNENESQQQKYLDYSLKNQLGFPNDY